MPTSATQFYHKPTGQHLCLGRHRPQQGRRLLRAERYLTPDAPPAPRQLAASPLAQDCMDRMLLTDQLGDCTIATTMKCSAQVLGSAGTRVVYSNAQAQDLYERACGYVPGKPDTDQGGDEVAVISYVAQHGIERDLHHWAGRLDVNGGNPEQVRQVVGRTRNLFLGVELAEEWLQVANGATLTRGGGPNPNNGHAIPAGGRQGLYVDGGLVLTMWGGIEVVMPWDVLAEYTAATNGGELHTMITWDSLNPHTGVDVDGWDRAQILADFKGRGGTVLPA